MKRSGYENRKKAAGILLTAILTIALTACGNTGKTDSAAASSASSQITAAASSAAAQTAAAQETTAKAAASSAGQTGDTITVTDHAGNEVTVPKNIQRIAVCDIYPLPSVLCIFFDSAEKIKGIADASMTAAKNSLLGQLYPDILKADTGYIKGSEINTEELLKLKPDVAFYSAGNEKQGEALRKAGIPAVAISANKWHYDCIETLNNWMSLLSQMFPENDKSKISADYAQKIYDRVQSKVKDIPDDQRKKVFFLFQYSDSMISTSGENFFGNWWAQAVGAKNVAKELTKDNAVEVNMEQIYAWNPEMIFITNFNSAKPEDLYGNKVGNYDWSGIDAVKNKQAYKMPLGMYRSYTPGVDTPVTLLWMAKTVYPDLFSDVDITKETKDYYRTVFNVELTDEQANAIFAPSAEAGKVFTN